MRTERRGIEIFGTAVGYPSGDPFAVAVGVHGAAMPRTVCTRDSVPVRGEDDGR